VLNAAPDDRGGPATAPGLDFGEKKPELLQARVESTMEAVEETIGARLVSRSGSLAPSYAAVQYFSVIELELGP
jgi:hypothetical protein